MGIDTYSIDMNPFGVILTSCVLFSQWPLLSYMGPKNEKLQVRCGDLRWTLNSKIVFSLVLYIGMTAEFT